METTYINNVDRDRAFERVLTEAKTLIATEELENAATKGEWLLVFNTEFEEDSLKHHDRELEIYDTKSRTVVYTYQFRAFVLYQTRDNRRDYDLPPERIVTNSDIHISNANACFDCRKEEFTETSLAPEFIRKHIVNTLQSLYGVGCAW